ncbi:hypothetical protein GCM10009682_52610 [Luedemannella flava]|uniref:DUF3592 domain-containing protein n=1 Tax=Luedemannella flava TaxID=349316 RepID=A0ABN2MGD5_9ACTN
MPAARLRPDPYRSFKVGLLVIAVTFMACTGEFGRDAGAHAARLDRNGVESVAVVYDREPAIRGGDLIYVQYRLPDLDSVYALCASCDDDLDLGEYVQIRYDPADLDADVEQVGKESYTGRAILGWLGFSVLALFAGYVLFKIFRPSRPQP